MLETTDDYINHICNLANKFKKMYYSSPSVLFVSKDTELKLLNFSEIKFSNSGVPQLMGLSFEDLTQVFPKITDLSIGGWVVGDFVVLNNTNAITLEIRHNRDDYIGSKNPTDYLELIGCFYRYSRLRPSLIMACHNIYKNLDKIVFAAVNMAVCPIPKFLEGHINKVAVSKHILDNLIIYESIDNVVIIKELIEQFDSDNTI